MRITVTDLIEKFNITGEQAGYIIKEAKGLKVNMENIDIVNTGTANSEGELIYQVVSNSDKHICYI